MGYDAVAYLDGLPAESVGELHLGGFTPEEDESDPGSALLIDTHASPITDPVWALYAHAVRRFGPVPTMIEWDNDLPPFSTLLAEAAKADRVARDACKPESRRAVAG
jgi:uncharacterized protein (UPF0276 family)